MAIRQQHGNIFILPQCAASGDLSPRILHYKQAQTRRFKLKYGELKTEMAARKDIAERIASAFDEVLSWARKDIRTNLPLAHAVETVNLSRRIITDDEYQYARGELEKLIHNRSKQRFTRERLRHDIFLGFNRERLTKVINQYHNNSSTPNYQWNCTLSGWARLRSPPAALTLYGLSTPHPGAQSFPDRPSLSSWPASRATKATIPLHRTRRQEPGL